MRNAMNLNLQNAILAMGCKSVAGGADRISTTVGDSSTPRLRYRAMDTRYCAPSHSGDAASPVWASWCREARLCEHQRSELRHGASPVVEFGSPAGQGQRPVSPKPAVRLTSRFLALAIG